MGFGVVIIIIPDTLKSVFYQNEPESQKDSGFLCDGLNITDIL